MWLRFLSLIFSFFFLIEGECAHSSGLKSIALAHLLCTIRFRKSIPLAKKPVKVHKIEGYKIPVAALSCRRRLFLRLSFSFFCLSVLLTFFSSKKDSQITEQCSNWKSKCFISCIWCARVPTTTYMHAHFFSIHVCFIEFICCYPKNNKVFFSSSSSLISCMAMTTVGGAAKITNFKVPSSYIIEDGEKPDNPLVLDCEYEFQPNETGRQISWWLNSTKIYQWIVETKPPTVLVSITQKQTHKRKYRKIEHSKPI